EPRSHILLEVLEPRSHIPRRFTDPFFDHLEPRVRTPFHLLDALVDRARLVGQSTSNSHQERDDYGDQLPDGLTNSCTDDLIKLVKIATHFGELLGVLFNLVPQGRDFRVKRCAHEAPLCEPRISRAL